MSKIIVEKNLYKREFLYIWLLHEIYMIFLLIVFFNKRYIKVVVCIC